MKEELLPNDQYYSATHPYFDELLTRYCSGIKEKICSAHSRREAELIVKNTCEHFSQSCVSEIIPTFLTRYFKKLIHQCWGGGVVFETHKTEREL